MTGRHAYVLIHSPIAGPITLHPLAEALRAREYDVAVPELTDDGSPPFWRQHARCVVRGIAEELPPGVPLVLVAYSAAGQLLGVLGPVLRDAGYQVGAEIFVDAGLPPGGISRLDQLEQLNPELAAEVRTRLENGDRYPAWTDDQLAPVLPDEDRRHDLLGALRPPPAAYWVENIPTSVDWPDAPVGALVFSQAYASTAHAAHDHGWRLRELDVDNHLLPLVDETRIADALVSLTQDLMPGEQSIDRSATQDDHGDEDAPPAAEAAS